ncbi:MAG: FtsH protease activity modulator HflK [Neomegalonema sp.]|nr:FtsH protease activity modulator HflK [Neomegalonema sp.]
MPWSNDGGGPKSSGPWGGGGNRNNGGGQNPWGGGNRPNGGGQGPNIDDFFKKGSNQFKSMFGEGGGFGVLLVLLIAAMAWIYASVFTVQTNERAVILTFGKFSAEVGPGLNFAPWPIQTAIIREVTTENTVAVGRPSTPSRLSGATTSSGLILTGDENIIDMNFQVVWVIGDLRKFLFNLAAPEETIRAVAESAMRQEVGRSKLAPLLNERRGQLRESVMALIQKTLDEYGSGVRIVRLTIDRVDPPPPVIASFRAVQAAEQERDTRKKVADRYYNETTASARGEARELTEAAEAYRAEQIAAAQGEAARFKAILAAYLAAPEVTKQRLYIETMKEVLTGATKVFIDSESKGMLPVFQLDQLGKVRAATEATKKAATPSAPSRLGTDSPAGVSFPGSQLR